MEWLNETLPTRVLLAFVGGLTVVVLWKAIEHLFG
jgi:MFS superfamily sulfate permease-like transporter